MDGNGMMYFRFRVITIWGRTFFGIKKTIWGRTFFGIKILKQEFSARQIQRITNISSGVIARL